MGGFSPLFIRFTDILNSAMCVTSLSEVQFGGCNACSTFRELDQELANNLWTFLISLERR